MDNNFYSASLDPGSHQSRNTVHSRAQHSTERSMESPPGSARSGGSPEAAIGHRVEDLWDVLEPQLSPSEKLNSCFESIPVSSFPPAPPSQVIEIPSDSSLADAVETLSKHKILGAPVRDVDAPDDASWIDRYIGIVEFSGIAVWLLHQTELAALGKMCTSSAAGLAAGGLAATVGAITLGTPASVIGSTALACAAVGGATAAVGPAKSGADAADSMGGSFFETLTSSDFYKNTKVRDISGPFRWAPFLALQNTDSFLTMLLLLSKYRMKSLPVIDLGEGKIENIITQSAVVHMLAECVGLHWFENWGTKKLFELGLPIMKPGRLIKVREDVPVLKAFQLMRKKGIGGLPVVDGSENKAIGNISIRDVQYLLAAPEIYKDYRSITAKDFLTAIRNHLEENKEASPMLCGVITCKRDDTLKNIILRLDSEKIHRIYVVDEEENLEGVITLRDIISKLVHEPHNYFGDFFDGFVPLPPNSRV